MSTNDDTQNTDTMNTEKVPLMRRSTIGGGDVDLPAPTSPLVRQGAPPTETVSDSELDICGGGVGLRALLSARISTWPGALADASGGVHPFIRPSPLRRFHGLTERDGFADFVERAYQAAKAADVMLELAMVPLLEGKSEAMIDCLVGDIAGRIRERMAMFNPVAVGSRLYYGGLVQLVAAAKEDARAMPLPEGGDDDSDVNSDVDDADHEVTGVADDDGDGEGDGEGDGGGEDEEDAGAEADTEDENGDDGAEADTEGGPATEDRIQHVEQPTDILHNEVSIGLPLWLWLAGLVAFAAWAAFVNGVLSRELGCRPFGSGR